MHERWGDPRPRDAGQHPWTPRAYRTRRSEPRCPLDGVMVPLRAGEDGRAEASWREAACGTVFLPRRRGRVSEDPLSRPHAGERQGHTEGAARKRSRTYQAAAPRRQDRRYRRRRRRQLDLPGDPVARNRGYRLLACLRTSPNGIRPCGGLRLVREVPRGSASRPLRRRQGDPGVAPPS